MNQQTPVSKKTGTILIVSGPSGSGKTSLCKMLAERNPNLHFSVSCTTRNPRPGEVDGRDYWFITEKDFKEKLKNNHFTEHAEVHGCYYGTPRRELEDYTEKGKDVLLDIDVAGARQVRRHISETGLTPGTAWIFIAPPGLKVMEQRLRKRATEEETVILQRLKHARNELNCWREYDYLIINDTLESAAADFQAVLQATRCRTANFKHTPWET